MIFFVVFTLLWDFALLRGLRWVWLATLILGVGGLLINLMTGTGTWHGYLLSVVGYGLLLAAPTRRFFAKREAAVAT